ncbi:hypothetical protein [Mesorhizobium onobrychidis]|uniref:hypothetical protein n=1 Tax=Mesorhizobium onobrychidis TaxID=2775404 RepID=UPI002867BD0A|nr:hypothetical protein [Mesorhizobium onobrychidis]
MPAIHVLACAGAGARKPPGNEPAGWRLGFRQTLALSTAYQAGVVAWVAFWAFYGRGFTAENAMAITTFGGAYMLVVIVEPLTDLAVLAIAKALHSLKGSGLVERRLYSAA